MQINDPTVMAELTAQHAIFEKALMENDVAALDALFWDSPFARRYGVMENLHGSAQIHQSMEVLTLGNDTGVINLEFTRSMEGMERQGRQTQIWARLPEGWRIVSAHVSLIPAAASYVDAASAKLGLTLTPASRGAVQGELERVTAIAQFVMEFPLDPGIEAAPVFQP